MMGPKKLITYLTFCRVASKSDRERFKGFSIPDSVECHNNIVYGFDSKWNSLDVYRPKNVTGKLPVIVSCHGGGFIYGDKDLYSFYTSDFVRDSFCVINYNYHLAPKHIFPTAIVETNEVFTWMCQNADEYGFDLDNVFIIGDSAGAQLASQYCVMYSNPDYAKVMECVIPNFKLRAACFGCGMYALSNNDKSNTRVLETIYLTDKPEKFGEKVNVLNYICKDFPPAFLISSPGDFLLANLAPMEKRLKDQGVVTESKIYGDETTGHVFFTNIKTDLGIECNNDQIAFMKKWLNK